MLVFNFHTNPSYFVFTLSIIIIYIASEKVKEKYNLEVKKLQQKSPGKRLTYPGQNERRGFRSRLGKGGKNPACLYD